MSTYNVYNTWDLSFEKAQGATLTDTTGKTYLDFYGGHGVISIGHNHPSWTKALTHQLETISYYSNAIEIPQQRIVSEKLNKLSGLNNYNLFLCNSGAEANENALKIAAFQTGRKKILALKGAFHGRTAGALAVTDNPSYQAPFGKDLLQEFIALNDVQAVKKTLETKEYAAVIVEGIQGVAGVFEPTAEMWEAIDTYTKSTGTIFIADEIQSGCGRTGTYFAFRHWGVTPDIITMAKGIGNGFPVAGLLINPDIPAVKGQLGTTFGGSYMACAAMEAVIDEISGQNLLENALKISEQLRTSLSSLDGVEEIRGRGLMLGIKLPFKATLLQTELLKNGIVTGTSSCPFTLRILPPLNISTEQANVFLTVFEKAVQQVMDLQPDAV